MATPWHVHFHCCVIDGVFAVGEDGQVHFPPARDCGTPIYSAESDDPQAYAIRLGTAREQRFAPIGPDSEVHLVPTIRGGVSRPRALARAAVQTSGVISAMPGK